MTAQVIHFPTDAACIDSTIRTTVKALMKGRGLSAEALAPKLGMSASSLYRKLSDDAGERSSFKAAEVAGLARELGVSVGQLFDGLGGTFGDDRVVRREGIEPPTR